METIYLCPSTPKGACPWEGAACDIEAHFEECHSDYFRESNFINLDVSGDNCLNYLMSLFGETYLIQTSYSTSDGLLELKLRYLGNACKAAKISYHLEVISGNFGYSSKSNYDGYNAVSNTGRGSIQVDVQTIKLTSGKSDLNYLLGYVHIENTLTRFAHRSIKRRYYEKKELDTKHRVSFRRRSDDKPDFTRGRSKDEHRNDVIVEVPVEEVPVFEIIYKTVEDIVKGVLDKVYKGGDKEDGDITIGRRYSESIAHHFAITNYTSPPQYATAVISEQETGNDARELIISNTYVPTAETPNVEYIASSPDIKSEETENAYYKKLKMIQCPKCSLYMIPPIYLCINGHSVCATCKNLNCDVCGLEITDLRNDDLEDVSRNITHPCRFAEKGCRDYCSLYEIRQHEIFCEYFKYTCPLCGVYGKFLEVKQHFKLIHPSVKIVDVSEHAFGRDSEFIIANKNGMFFCTSQVHDTSVEWKVDFCGVEKVSFSCEVVVKGKKQDRTYDLKRQGNGCSRIVSLNELKAAKLKEKTAVLFIRAY